MSNDETTAGLEQLRAAREDVEEAAALLRSALEEGRDDVDS